MKIIKGHLILTIAALLFTACQTGTPPEKDQASPLSAEEISLPNGFKAELLYSPGLNDQGSWVSITTDDKGRLISSDQYGNLYRMTPPEAGKSLSSTDIEVLNVELGHAQGLLYAFNSLYVSVNSNNGIAGNNSGFYRLQDTNGDDQFDKITQLKSFKGQGEHGPHAVILSPDGNSLYVIGGNHTDLPAMDHYLRPNNWAEDNLFPILKDPRGHAADRTAPGGWVAKTDENGSEWTLVSSGYRNPYDMALNKDGELFVFDSDMEWDMGMPWYRPIRVCHAIEGSEYGWRTGSGKFQPHYLDNLPPVVNIGQGSPTGVLYGAASNYPESYKDGLFIFDWSFGTIYFVNLQASGSSYVGTKEEFASGAPLPVADGVWGSDGAMYLVTGGRRGVSGMYRISYDGDNANVAFAKDDDDPEGESLRAVRKKLSTTYLNPSSENIDLIWEHLDHEDRFISYSAQIALEHHNVDSWLVKFLKEKEAGKLLPAAVALAHNDDKEMGEAALVRLNLVKFNKLNEGDQLKYLRALELVMMRLKDPGPIQKLGFINKLKKAFPSNNPELNMELGKLLTYLEAPSAVDKILAQMEQEANDKAKSMYISQDVTQRSTQYGPDIEKMLANFPPTNNIAYANYLSHAKEGWDETSRKQYFSWLFDATSKSGGWSYRGFIDRIRLTALNNLSKADREALGSLAESWDTGIDLSSLPQPEGPGQDWNKREVSNILSDGRDKAKDYEHGKLMYEAALCGSCHQMNGQGGNIGPDLSQAHTRFNTWSLLDAVISPSLEVSDQYSSTIFTLNDGNKVIGRLMDENADSVKVNTSPYDSGVITSIGTDQIAKREKSAVSPMPPGMLSRLNEEEILDLMAFIQSGGNPEHKIYTGKE